MSSVRTEFDISQIPTIALGDLEVYDAFVVRSLRENMVRTPQEMAGAIAYKSFGQMLSSGIPDRFSVIDCLGKRLWPLFVKHPSAPQTGDSGYVASVWRYLLVPSAFVSVGANLGYWADHNVRNMNWTMIGNQPQSYGPPHATPHAEEYYRSKQVLYEAMGSVDGAKYANALASRSNPRAWVKQLRKREKRTRIKMSDLGLDYEGLLCCPFTVSDEDERLIVWLLDKHFRHPDGPFLPGKREPNFIEYGAACATTYALLLSLFYGDTTGRFATLLPPLDSRSVARL